LGEGGLRVETSHTLAGITLFESLDEAERQRLESRCTWRRYAAGETVLDLGGEGREVLFIVAGSVNILNISLAGREIAYARLDAGDCVGEFAAIDGQPRSTSVVSAEPTLVAVLPSAQFIELLRVQAEVTFTLLQRLTGMVRTGDVRIMDLSTLGATQRVYGELLRMARPDTEVPSFWVIHPLPPLHEIASRISTTRETVARVLSQLYPTGLVHRKGKNLYIPDRDKFEAALTALQGKGGGQHHV
jgi:CRP-like cAMP-binding protein